MGLEVGVRGPGPSSSRIFRIRSSFRRPFLRVARGAAHEAAGKSSSTRLYIGLLIFFLALVGTLLHPVSLLLRLAPFDARYLVATLTAVKTVITDLLGWSLFSLLLVMSATVWKERWKKGRNSTGDKLAERIQTREPTSLRGPARVAVVITAYNDAAATARAVEEFKAQEGVVEILVIDNNSSDGTGALATAAGATVIHEVQQGYGYACIRGLREAAAIPEADVIVLTEGDGTFVAGDLNKFRAYIDQTDMVVGTRVVPGLVEKGSQMDHFLTWGNLAVAALLRLRFWNSQFLGAACLSDVGCTFRAIRRDALQGILPDLVVGGMHFSVHMMLVALARGLSIIEIPVTFRRRVGRSKGASQNLGQGLKVGLSMIWHIMTYAPAPGRRATSGANPVATREVAGRAA